MACDERKKHRVVATFKVAGSGAVSSAATPPTPAVCKAMVASVQWSVRRARERERCEWGASGAHSGVGEPSLSEAPNDNVLRAHDSRVILRAVHFLGHDVVRNKARIAMRAFVQLRLRSNSSNNRGSVGEESHVVPPVLEDLKDAALTRYTLAGARATLDTANAIEQGGIRTVVARYTLGSTVIFNVHKTLAASALESAESSVAGNRAFSN